MNTVIITSIYTPGGRASKRKLTVVANQDQKSKELPVAVESEIKKIQEKRLSKRQTGAYAVIAIDGHKELNIKDASYKETDQFSICFNAVDKWSIRSQHERIIHSIVTSLAISTSPEYHAGKIASGICFYDDNKKPLYSYTLQGGQARIILPKSIDSLKKMKLP